jgi:hypothetical protein
MSRVLLGTIAELLSIIDHIGIAEGYCCCGDSMEHHANPMDCGHSPVDAGYYYHGPVVDRAIQLIKENINEPSN